MTIEICNAELEDLLRLRTKAGNFSTVEDMLLDALRPDEDGWTAEERLALNEKIEFARHQAATGQTFTPQEARRKLADMRAMHLANQGN